MTGVIAGERALSEVEDGVGRLSGDGRRLRVANTQDTEQMICSRIVHLKLV